MKLSGLQSFTVSLLYLRFGLCNPTVSFPISSQIPPLAYPGRDFSFAFAGSTFSSTFPLKYTLSSSVIWLKLDATTRKLFGHVPAKFRGTFTANVTATDKEGSVADTAVFSVADRVPIQLSTFSNKGDDLQFNGVPANGFGGYLLTYSQRFNLSIPKKLLRPHISESEEEWVYYAMTGDNTPLPNWIQFDPYHDKDDLFISGNAPPLFSPIAPPQWLPVRIMSSKQPGYESARIEFNLVVGARKFYFRRTSTEVSVFEGDLVDVNLPALLSGETEVAYGSSELKSMTFKGPSWLKFDKVKGQITGKVPRRLQEGIITGMVTAIDKNGDTAATTVWLKLEGDVNNFSLGGAKSDLFAVPRLSSVNATMGGTVNCKLSPSVFRYYGLDIDVNFSPKSAGDWIKFDENELVFRGNVPNKFSGKRVTVNVTATLEQRSATSFRTFDIRILPQKSPKLTSADTSSNKASGDNSGGGGSSKKQRNVLLIVLFAIFGAILLALILVYCYLHRRKGSLCAISCMCAGLGKRSREENEKPPATPPKDAEQTSWDFPGSGPLGPMPHEQHERSVSNISLPAHLMPAADNTAAANTAAEEGNDTEIAAAAAAATTTDNGRHGIPRKDSDILPKDTRVDEYYRNRLTPSPRLETDEETFACTPSSKRTTPSPSRGSALSPFPYSTVKTIGSLRQFRPRNYTPPRSSLQWPSLGSPGSNHPAADQEESGRASIRLVVDPAYRPLDEVKERRSSDRRRSTSTENWRPSNGRKKRYLLPPHEVEGRSSASDAESPIGASSLDSSSSLGTYGSISDEGETALGPPHSRSASNSSTWRAHPPPPAPNFKIMGPRPISRKEITSIRSSEINTSDEETDGSMLEGFQYVTERRRRRPRRSLSHQEDLNVHVEDAQAATIAIPVPIYTMFSRSAPNLPLISPVASNRNSGTDNYYNQTGDNNDNHHHHHHHHHQKKGRIMNSGHHAGMVDSEESSIPSEAESASSHRPRIVEFTKRKEPAARGSLAHKKSTRGLISKDNEGEGEDEDDDDDDDDDGNMSVFL